MKNILIYFCFLIVLAACEPPVYFDSPQPSNGKVEQTFNKKYVGRYKSTTADGVFLEVSEEKVISERFWEVKQTRAAIDTLEGYKWRKDQLYYNNELQKITIKDDTIVIHGHSKKMIFENQGNNVLKSYKGMFFLNEEYEPGWKVQKLHLTTKNKLILSRISSAEEIELMQELTEVDAVRQNDTSGVQYYKVNPSEDEFNDILDGSFFTVEDIYIRVD